MCGIVGISGNKSVTERLVRGLSRLEYRGYDSAGIAVLADDGTLVRRRALGKIAALRQVTQADPVDGHLGIAHTRWATHGAPSEANAHPHRSGPVAVVHNGIIENFQDHREALEKAGHVFESETDSEVIAHLLARELEDGATPRDAMATVLPNLRGAFAIAAIFEGEDGVMIGARKGSPLVLGYGDGEMYLGSDALALAPFTRTLSYLEEGDWVVVTPQSADIFNEAGAPVERAIVQSAASAAMAEKGEYAHFMHKEIHEQAESLSRSLAPYLAAGSAQLTEQSKALGDVFKGADRAVAIGCGTAYYAAATAKYWFEQVARLPFETDIASEYRYRAPVLPTTGPALFISQSGETADTLASLRHCIEEGAPTLGVVNVPESSIAREVTAMAPTAAGPEIGVASTKAFTAQLAVLAALSVIAGAARGTLDGAAVEAHVKDLLALPRLVTEALGCEDEAKAVAPHLVGAKQIFYLGRGPFFPIALEGALKLKEISYIPTEGFAAGELKHGPIALIEEGTPVLVVAPNDALIEKTISNIQEVRARGADVTLITDEDGAEIGASAAQRTLVLPKGGLLSAPIIMTLAVQMIAYHTAVACGTDVDQPRNLAKSVTVE
ncbi:MAG: glutamine--fructose-6-phosphate transaminase (isomerizing) [Pseudomonadota bacterium]